jgi:hypothetical protein
VSGGVRVYRSELKILKVKIFELARFRREGEASRFRESEEIMKKAKLFETVLRGQKKVLTID